MPDGLVKHVHIVIEAVGLDSENREFVGTVMDVTARKRAEEAWQKAQAELAHVSRVATMGELTASIAHEINQPLGAIANTAQACLRFVATGSENLQNLKKLYRTFLKGLTVLTALSSACEHWQKRPRRKWLN
jgi:phosphoglycerate-specific signal transduction histidine kinase